MRRTSLLVLGAAVVVGGWLRLSGLGKYEMTADEAATWIAASAPTVRQVVAIAGEVNPGKLALHDVTLHAWILAFGDSIGSMRTLSAILGTIAIGLVYLVGVELFQSGALPDADAAEIAAIGALVFALCPAAVSLSREARMYPVMLDVALAQVWVLIRAARSGGAASCAAAGILALTAMAANFTVGLMIASEGIWLLLVLWLERAAASRERSRHAWALVAALVLAGVCLAAVLPWRHETQGYQRWSGWMEPASAYILRISAKRALRRNVVAVTIALAEWGAILGWRRSSKAIVLALLWMWLPALCVALWLGLPRAMLLPVGYAWTPIFLGRYVLTSYVPFSLLVGLGIHELNLNYLRWGAIALVVLLALGRLRDFSPKTYDDQWGTQWREAAELVVSNLKRGEPVNVRASPFPIRYYLRHESGVNPELLQKNRPDAQTLIMSDQFQDTSNDEAAALRQAYPHVVARLNLVWVLRR